SPVLPAVASTMVPPELSRPSRSAASIMVRAGRSLIEPDGLALSSLRKSRHGPRSMRVTSTSGVSPMRSRTETMSRFHPFHPRPGPRLGLFHGGEMAAVRHDDQARAGDAGGDLLRQRRRRELVAGPDQHEGGTADRGEQRPRVGPRHERLLLAQK